MSGPTSRKRNRAVSLAAKDGGDEAPPMSALAAQHASEQLLVAAMGSARFSAAEVAKLVAEGGPLDELINIALVQSNKHAVREGGAIPLIVGLLREDGGLVPSAAAWPSLRATTVVSALWSLAAHTPLNQDAIRLAGGVPRLVAQVQCPPPTVGGGRPAFASAASACAAFAFSACAAAPPGAAVAGSGEFCSAFCPELAGHAAGALWSLAANSAANQHAVREAGGIARLVQLLEVTVPWQPEAARLAAGALRNLAADSPENKDLIRRLGGVPPLVRMLTTPRVLMLTTAETAAATFTSTACEQAGALGAQQAAGALANLASNTTAEQDAIREAGGIPPLVALLHGGEGAAAAQHAAGALWNLAAGNTTNQDVIREAGGIPPLIALLRPGAPVEAAQQAAGALRNLAASNASNKEAIRGATHPPSTRHSYTRSADTWMGTQSEAATAQLASQMWRRKNPV